MTVLFPEVYLIPRRQPPLLIVCADEGTKECHV